MAILKQSIRRLLAITMLSVFCLTTGCAQSNPSVRLLDLPNNPTDNEVRKLSGEISEVAPPAIFLDLANLASNLAPQVEIAYPKADQTLLETKFAAKIKLRGLSIYKDEETQLGPHLKVILDNQPAQAVYNLDNPIEFSELLPGSHTLRVFAVLPWGESFKNPNAYAQTTFHVLAKTTERTPAPNQPVLTYNEPQGTFGSQPVLLDFHLNNAPLHLVATESAEDSIRDWQIRCSVNGQTFLFDQWQPVYLKGLKPGKNWVQITLVDEQGDRIDGPFNSTVRLINYDPDLKNTLAQLVRGELPIEKVGQIIQPDYVPPVEPLLEKQPEAAIVEDVIEAEGEAVEDSAVEDSADEDSADKDSADEAIVEETVEPAETLDENLEDAEQIESEDRLHNESTLIKESEDELDPDELDNQISPDETLSKQTAPAEQLPFEAEDDSQSLLNNLDLPEGSDGSALEQGLELRESIPDDLNAPAEENRIDFSDKSGNPTVAAPVDKNPIGSEPTETEPTETEPTETEPSKNQVDSISSSDDSQLLETEPLKTKPSKPETLSNPGFLENLKTRWYSFQKAQAESQSATIQPSTVPTAPILPVEADPSSTAETETEASLERQSRESTEQQTSEVDTSKSTQSGSTTLDLTDLESLKLESIDSELAKTDR